MIDQKNPKIISCQSLNNNGKGIWLKGSSGVLVEGNLLAGNKLYGIQDESPIGLSTYVGNEARFNGSSHRDNYVGLPPKTPIRTWTVSSPADAKPLGQLENTSISLPFR